MAQVSQWPGTGKVAHIRSPARTPAPTTSGPLGSIAAVQRVLEIAVLDTLRLENSVARSRVLMGIAGVAARLLEAEREEGMGWDAESLRGHEVSRARSVSGTPRMAPRFVAEPAATARRAPDRRLQGFPRPHRRDSPVAGGPALEHHAGYRRQDDTEGRSMEHIPMSRRAWPCMLAMTMVALTAAGAAVTAQSPSASPGVPTPAVDLVIPVDGAVDVIGLAGSVWVSQIHADDVVRLDPVSGEVQATVATGAGSGPGSFATDGTFLYIPNQRGGGVSKIDPATDTVVGIGEPDARNLGGAPVLAGGSLWVSREDGQAFRIDPMTMTTTATMHAGGGYVAAGGLVWGVTDGGITHTDPATDVVTQTGICCAWPSLAVDGTVWAFPGDHTVLVIDVATATLRTTLDLGTDVSGGTAGDGYAWLLAPSVIIGESRVLKVDPASGTILASVALPSLAPSNLRLIDGQLWVTSFDGGEVMRIPAF